MRKLNIELIPDSCWYSNLRSVLSKKAWEFIKKDARERTNGKCAICGKKVKILDTHEVWQYDEKSCTQKLVDVIAICKDCHSAIHMERTSLLGDIERAENHYMKVNGISYAEMKKDRQIANDKHRKLNEVSEWKLDATWLKRFTEK